MRAGARAVYSNRCDRVEAERERKKSEAVFCYRQQGRTREEMGWNSVLGEGWRLLQASSSSSSMSEYDDDDVWTPLETADYTHLGITITYQIVVLLVVVHLWICRDWPPYIPR